MPVKDKPKTELVRVEAPRLNDLLDSLERIVHSASRQADGAYWVPRARLDAAWDALVAFRREGDDSRCPDCGKAAG